jgi:hypothetical protein
MKKVTFAFSAIILFLFFLPHTFACADTAGNVQINEIMYDLKTGSDSGREWVEVYNSSNSGVDFSTFTFFENDTNHKLKLVQGDKIIPPYGYAVIVDDYTKFKADWPGLSGFSGNAVSIFDSTFSLSNTGETLAIKNANGNTSIVVDQYTYSSTQGGAGDGNSLQKINGVWQGALPTPGAENKPSPAPVIPASSTSAPTSKTTSASKISGAKNTNPNIISMPANFTGTSAASPGSGKGGEHSDNSFFLIAILIIFVGFSAGAVYSMRKSKQNSAPGDDFDLLEE